MQVNSAQRDRGRDVLQVVLARAHHLQRLAVGLAPLLRHRDLAPPVRYCPVMLSALAMTSGVPCGDDPAAVDAGAGADVDHVVGGAGWRPRRARPRARCCRCRAGASASRSGGRCRAGAGRWTARRARRDADQAGADLRGQPDALASPPDRVPDARERQVVEADIDQELQPLADLLQDARGDLVLLLGELPRQLGKPVVGRAGSTGP